MMNPEPPKLLSPEQKKEVAAFAKKRFAFLKTEKGFTRPLVNQPSNGLLIYRNMTMGMSIRMYFSSSDSFGDYDDMSVLLGKLGSDGNFPPFPYLGEERVRSVWMLQSFLLRQLHVQERQILALDHLLRDFREQGHWDVARWQLVLSSHQALLRDHIDLILQQPSEILFPTTPEYLWIRGGEFAKLARDHFAFLHEYGFRPDPVIERYGASYTWISVDRGVTLLMDFRDRDISCSIIKLIGGLIPTSDPKDLKRAEFTRGRHVEISLYTLLARQLGMRDADLDTFRNIETLLCLRDFSDYDFTYASTVISLYARLIRRYISQLMSAPL